MSVITPHRLVPTGANVPDLSKGTSLLSTKDIPVDERLIVALDVTSHRQAYDLVDQLGDAVKFYKVGLELFLAGNYQALIRDLVEDRGKKVFVDLKFFDVPETVGAAVEQLQSCGATFATVHGNDQMLKYAVEARGTLKVLAVTVLTSLDQADLHDLGFRVSPEALTLSRTRRAIEIGCDGVVCSGQNASALRTEYGHNFFIVSPGIRPVANQIDRDDQKRTTTHIEAFENGADYIVLGRPIRDEENPREFAEKLQAEIADLFTAQAD